MSEYKYEWQGELIAVLLETDRVQLERKINVADGLFRKRIMELREHQDWQTNGLMDEYFALQDALRTLRYLRQVR